MKKLLILGAFLAFFSCSQAIAENESGIGFEYSGGYMSPWNAYEMRAVQSFALTMALTKSFSAAIFREEGTIRAENSYTGEDDGTGTTAATAAIKLSLIDTADISITGLKFKHKIISLPWNLMIVKAGVEIGTARFSNGATAFRATGGSGTTFTGLAPTFADGTSWGLPAAGSPLSGINPVFGLLGDVIIFTKKTDTLDISVFAAGSYRLIDLADSYSLGRSKEEFADANKRTEYEPITEFNSLSVTVGINIGF